MGQARALLGIEDPALQLVAFEKTLQQDLSVRKVESLVKKLKQDKEAGAATRPDDMEGYEDLREHLSHFFGTSIDFKRNNNGAGKIVIPFKTDEDLQRIVSILDKPGS